MSKRTRGPGGTDSSTSENEHARHIAEAVERRRKRSESIVTDATRAVDNSDPEALLNEKFLKWQLQARGASLSSFTQLAFNNFGLAYDGDINLQAAGEFGLRDLDEKIQQEEREAISLYGAIKKIDPRGERPDLQQRATKVIEMVYYAKRVVLSAFQARLAVHELHCEDHQLAPDLDLLLGSWTLRFRWFDQTKSTPLQKLLLHLLDVAMEKRYRKHAGYVYEPIVVDGHETHAWRQVQEIKEFVYDNTKKEVYYEQWYNLTASGNNAKAAVEHLASCNDYQFQFLKRDRSVFSFRNGVYLAREDRFCRFGCGEKLSDSIVAAKFFDTTFDAFEGAADWRDIPTPNLQRIMDYQEWDADVCDWMYIMLGRLLYNVNELDGWQVVPFLLGSASSGKSTLALKVAKLFYEHADVGVMSNNIERQFGISAFFDKLLFVAPEIKGDLKVEQAEFQSIVSGESIQISAKHKKSFTWDWNTPGIMAGNEVPAFSDNSGSVQRRFFVFSFVKAVVDGDMKLGDKLAAEMPCILLKCNRAYLHAAARYGGKNVWTVVPRYFHDTRNEMAQAVNSVEAFLVSAEVAMADDRYCPLRTFQKAWQTFARSNGYNLQGKPIVRNLFTTPFDKYKLRIVKDTREYQGVVKNNIEWVVGADVVVEASDAAFALG